MAVEVMYQSCSIRGVGAHPRGNVSGAPRHDPVVDLVHSSGPQHSNLRHEVAEHGIEPHSSRGQVDVVGASEVAEADRGSCASC